MYCGILRRQVEPWNGGSQVYSCTLMNQGRARLTKMPNNCMMKSIAFPFQTPREFIKFTSRLSVSISNLRSHPCKRRNNIQFLFYCVCNFLKIHQNFLILFSSWKVDTIVGIICQTLAGQRATVTLTLTYSLTYLIQIYTLKNN